MKGPHGELAIPVQIPATGSAVAGDEDVADEVRRLVEAGLSARDIAERMKPRGVPRRRVYNIVATLRDERG